MKDLFEYLQKMGGMHDAIVEQFTWKQSEQTIEFRFEDLYSNFDGLPEYPGKRSGAIILREVSDVRIDIETNGPLRVFEFLADESASDAVVVTFSPSGKFRIRFRSADYPPCELAGVVG